MNKRIQRGYSKEPEDYEDQSYGHAGGSGFQGNNMPQVSNVNSQYGVRQSKTSNGPRSQSWKNQ